MADITVFDRVQVRRQRDRAAASIAAHGFLFDEVADRLVDRLHDITRRFPTALDLGCHTGQLGRRLIARGGVERLVSCDLSPKMAAGTGGAVVAGDEEALAFAPNVFDLVASNLSLHWVNDLPGALIQINRVLKPDGLFLASMLGGETLNELRRCLIEAELIEESGASPRSPALRRRARCRGTVATRGFALPVVDIDTIAVTYADPMRLLIDLRGMGETNATIARRRGFLRRGTLARALSLY